MRTAAAVIARGVLAVAVTLGSIEVFRLLTGAGWSTGFWVVLVLIVTGAGLEAWGQR